MDRFQLFIFFSRFQFLSRKFTSPHCWWAKTPSTNLLPKRGKNHCFRGITDWLIERGLSATGCFPIQKSRSKNFIDHLGGNIWLNIVINSSTEGWLLLDVFPSKKSCSKKFIFLWIWKCVGVRSQLQTVSGFPTLEGEFPLVGEGQKKVGPTKKFLLNFQALNLCGGEGQERVGLAKKFSYIC